jgi:hypothetical protein
MDDGGFDSPERAAIEGFPPEHCRVIASRADGDDAYVLLNAGSTERPYLYGVNCRQEGGRWFEGASGNGPGWARTSDDPDVGTLSLWGDAPPGGEMVRVEFDGQVIDEPVREDAYLIVWWRVPAPRVWPRVTGFRVLGSWVRHERPDEFGPS